jgi:hypothetical protein
MGKPRPRDWIMRVKIWQCLARGDSIMATQRFFETHLGDEGYPRYAPSRDTISKIRRELFTLVERLPETLTTLPPEVQAYVISKRPKFKDKVRFVDLDAEDVCSYEDYILKVTGKPYRNREGAMIVTLDILQRFRGSPF